MPVTGDGKKGAAAEKPSSQEGPVVSRRAKVTSRERPLSQRHPTRIDAQSAKGKRASTVEIRKEMIEETKRAEEVKEFSMPEWYKDPSVKPELVKAGIAVFCSGQSIHY